MWGKSLPNSTFLIREVYRYPYKGNLKRASHPLTSSRFSSVRAPPCASAIWRESTSPMPEPEVLVLKNGTKRLAVVAKIGRASRRGRREISVGAVWLKKKTA